MIPTVVLLLNTLGSAQEPSICPPRYIVDGYRQFQVVGGSVGSPGDLDGDGHADFFVASAGPPGINGPRGDVCVYSGMSGEPVRCWYGEPDQGYAGFGLTAGAGDIDGDGTPDLIVSASAYNFQAGRVYLFSAGTGELLHTWDNPQTDYWFGGSIAGGGDFDGDGIPDIVVGHPGFNSGLIEFPGQVYLYSGATKELIRTWVGESPADHFGWDVAVLRDFDGDGRSDLLVGAPWNWPGKAYVFSGATGEQIWFRTGDDAGAVFGASVSSAGDVNGDGLDDLLIGDYYHEGPPGFASNYGQAYLITSGDHEILYTWTGEGWTDFFGFAVAGVGDVNGDGVPDALIGAYSHDGPAGWNSGKAYVYSGASGNLLWSAVGEGGMDMFAATLGAVGDVDGNGRNEIVVGAHYHDGPAGPQSGRAYVFEPVPPGCDCADGLTLGDLSAFVACMQGPGHTDFGLGCYCADLDVDEDVDLHDFARVQLVFLQSS